MKQTAKVQLRIPEELHLWIVEWAKQNHRSMNNQILTTLEDIRKAQMKTATQPSPSKELEA